MWKTRTNEVDLVCFEGLKTPAPPLQQPILLGAQRHPWARFVAYCNAINLEAIFEFPPQTSFLLAYLRFELGIQKIASMRLIALRSATN